ncbi:MAG: PTS sugar transporter subunit IIB [Clostridium butyricum]|nr:PTS sugar transporter subunit IIB [Clostridium butyricum]
MVTIRLFCAAGMSTSLLVKKMKEAASKRGIETNIAAFPEGQMAQHLDGVNVALLGPQVGYTLSKAKQICEPKNIPVEVIPMIDYGMMNGEKVLDFALNLIK